MQGRQPLQQDLMFLEAPGCLKRKTDPQVRFSVIGLDQFRANSLGFGAIASTRLASMKLRFQ